MKNVFGFKYFQELDQHSIVEGKAVKYNFPDLEKVVSEFWKYVGEVIPSDKGDAIHIGISFTNDLMQEIYVTGKHIIRSHINPMFWPVYGEIEYKFKKGNFFLNEGVDPRKIVNNVGFDGGKFGKYFFTKNPYENKEIYRKDFNGLLPDLFVDEKRPSLETPTLWDHFKKIPKFKPRMRYY
jgi:hypothetical protein